MYVFQVAFYEIVSQMWVRNGLQIRGQAITYIQCHFSNSMVDPDLFLLQLCSTRLDPSVFLKTILERFHVQQWLSLAKDKEAEPPKLVDQEHEIPMMESALIFLVSLLTLRTNLGLSDQVTLYTDNCGADTPYSSPAETANTSGSLTHRFVSEF